MSKRTILFLTLSTLLCTVLVPRGAGAGYVLVADFEPYATGPVDDQWGWYASDATSTVGGDPERETNRVLSVLTASTFLFHAAPVPQGETRMLFLRFRYEEQLSVSFGLSESSFPDQFGNFEAELSLTSTRDDLRINDDGKYTAVAVLEPGRWYNCWMQVDNGADVTAVWLHDRDGDDALPADRLAVEGRDLFLFREGTGSDLRNFFIKTGGGDGVSGPLLVDDIHVSDSGELDLSNPVGTLSAAGDAPAGLRLVGAAPNPFNPRTRVAFALDAGRAVVLSVFDLAGRRVRVLADREFAAGVHAVEWDGRDDSGAELASGLYLARVEDGRTAAVGKLVLSR